MTNSTASTTTPAGELSAYPLPAPEADPRFTYGLVLDIADVLVGHGFPPPACTDWTDLTSAVFGFLYQPEQETP